jgi:hypothetical protein
MGVSSQETGFSPGRHDRPASPNVSHGQRICRQRAAQQFGGSPLRNRTVSRTGWDLDLGRKEADQGSFLDAAL